MPALGGVRGDAVAVHYDIKPPLTPEVAYSLALIVIGAGGAIIGTVVWFARLIGRRLLAEYHLESPHMEKVDA